MKRIFILLALIILTGANLLPIASAAPGPNLVVNPSLELSLNTTSPDSWVSQKWGTNTTKFSYLNTGRTGSKSVQTQVTAYTSGDARWSFNSVAVKPNTSYTYSDWYQSSAISGIDIVVTTTSNTTSYIWVANPAISSTWKQASYTFTTPANAAKVTVYHYLEKVGQLTIDDVSLAETNNSTTPPPVPAPPTVSVTAPANNSAVSGTTALTATASGSSAITGVQFKVDGMNIGAIDTTAPYTASWNTTSATNGSHIITAVATDANNLSSTSSAITVTVNNMTSPPPVPPTPGNLIPNPSVETSSNNSPTGWLNGSWGTSTRSLTYEPTGRTGTKSLKAQITSYTSGDAKWYFSPVTVTPGKSYNFTNYYLSNVDTEINAVFTMTNGTQQWAYLNTTAASPITWQKNSSVFTAPANAKSVSVMQILKKPGYVQTDDYSLNEYVPAQFNRAIVSLTFDDGWRSIYTNGLPLLQKYGLPSTQYLLTSTIDYPDYMTTAMMQEFKNQGSEIASHTVSHPHLTQLSPAQVTTELSTSQSLLRQWFGTPGVANNFATPYGEYNAAVINQIKQYYRSHRSTDVGYNSKDNFDIYNIKVQNITNTTTPADVQAWVNKAISDKSWLVLVYHEVSYTPTSATYAVTPANLDQELNIIKQSGVSVQTIDQALNELVPQL